MSNQYARSTIKSTSSTITLADRWIHILCRWGIKRNTHRIEPGLYSLGDPNQDSPVFVTANYQLSFDAVRSALKEMDCFILVLDTRGINVWCAAGKGTFGTDELLYQIEVNSLHNIVNHRKLILPQLGATGVAAHDVKHRSGFRVEYGPVRAVDLPQFLKTHKATPEMRRVRFTFKDRLILVPVEVVGILIPMLIISISLYLLGGILSALAAIAAFVAGSVLFPILLPWLPTPNFSTKGFILGGVVILPFALIYLFEGSGILNWKGIGLALASLLTFPAITAFIALNFTGATTFTSKSSVRGEIFRYIPKMAWVFGIGLVISLMINLIQILGEPL
jgi:hypothetical protein